MQTIQINSSSQATVLEALKATHEVKTGFVCTSANDIQCIDGVCNRPSEHKYWTIEVNGNYQDFNSQSLVNPKDKVVLKFSSMENK